MLCMATHKCGNMQLSYEQQCQQIAQTAEPSAALNAQIARSSWQRAQALWPLSSWQAASQ